MSLEGRLRDLRPLELGQLLSSSRKTGVLLVRAPLHARALELRFEQGAVVGASQWPLYRSSTGELEPGAQSDATSVRAVSDAVLDLLTWREGDFRFVAASALAAPPSTLRVAMEPLLVEAMQCAEVWDRVADRGINAHVVPAFVDVDAQQLPLLRLAPQEWETLTRVDGRRDVTALAAALDRDVLDIAQIIHGLIGSGLLQIRAISAEPRRHPTPPAQSRAQQANADGLQIGDLWIPPSGHGIARSDESTPDDDSIFDPGPVDARAAWHDVSRVWRTAEISVASSSANPSIGTGEAQRVAAGVTLAMRGDDAARRGDLSGALTHWSAALRSDEPLDDADRIREAIALAARLHALLHPQRPAPADGVFARAE